MATLSFSQLVSLAQQAGLSPANARVAAAIALAESGGRTDAHNPVGADDSYGLWQINMRGPLGPARRSSLGLASDAALYDPATNARAMVAISGGGANWKPWSTFTNGAYKAKLATGDATPVPTTPGAAPPTTNAGFDPLCAINPLCVAQSAAGGVADFVVSSSYRVGAYAVLLLGAIALVVAGGYRIVAPNSSPMEALA